MKNKKSNFNYHKMVWGKAKKDTELYFHSDWKGWFGSIISGIVSGIFSVYLSYSWEKTSIIPIIISIIGIIMGTFFGWGAFVIALYGINGLWSVPAKLFKEKEDEANKFTWSDVLIETCNDMPKNNPLPTCLQVINNKPYNIENVIATIVSIKKGKINQIIYESSPINLGWSGEDGQYWGGRTLFKYKSDEDRRFLLVANWLIEGKGVFLLATSYENIKKGKVNFIELEMNIPYTLQLEWSGEIEDRKLNRHTTWFSLRYDENNIYLEEAK